MLLREVERVEVCVRHPWVRRLLQVALLVVLSVLALPGASAQPAWGALDEASADLAAVVPPTGDAGEPSAADAGLRQPLSARPAPVERQPVAPTEHPAVGPAALLAPVRPGAAGPVTTDRPAQHAPGLPGSPDGRAPPA